MPNYHAILNEVQLEKARKMQQERDDVCDFSVFEIPNNQAAMIQFAETWQKELIWRKNNGVKVGAAVMDSIFTIISTAEECIANDGGPVILHCSPEDYIAVADAA